MPVSISGGGGSGGAAVADNSASIGLTRVQGSNSTAMRSDGAPPLDVTIAPIWSGDHQHGVTDGIGGTNGTLTIWAESLPALLIKQNSPSARTGTLRMSALSAARVWSLPNKTGTFAMTDDFVGNGSDPAGAGTISAVNRTGQTANIAGPVIFSNAVGAGFYEIYVQLACTATGTGAPTLNITWASDGGTKTNVPICGPLQMDATTRISQFVYSLYLTSGNITWNVTGYTSGTYALRMRGTYLGA